MADNALLMALKRRRGPQADIQLPEPPRILEVRKSDVPGISDMKPGSAIHLEIDGKIKSVDADGRALVEVGQVYTEDAEPDQADDEEPVYVKTQESTSPGAA